MLIAFIRLACVWLLLALAWPVFAQEDEEYIVLPPADEFEARGWTPFQLSLFDPVQVFDRRRSVLGARFNLIYGLNANVIGLDLGLVNRAKGVVGPAQIGLWNESRHSFGLQISPFGNIARGSEPITKEDLGRYKLRAPGVWFLGPGGLFEMFFKMGIKSVKFAPLVVSTGDLYGFQLGLGFNSARDVYGGQCCGMFQSALGDLYGFQIGWMYNFAGDVVGLQATLLGSNIADNVVGLQANIIGYNTAKSIYGLQLGWINANENLFGLQLGLFNSNEGGVGIQLGAINTSGLVGLQLGLMNSGSIGGIGLGLYNDSREVNGLQIGILNVGGGTLRGIQIGAYNHAADGWGFQIGGINRGTADFAGMQIGVYNGAGEIAGLQIGGLNNADHVKGTQIGVINWADRLTGLQIGVLNFNLDGVWVLPGINFGASDLSAGEYLCRQQRAC